MKKALQTLVIILLIFSFTGCAKKDVDTKTPDVNEVESTESKSFEEDQLTTPTEEKTEIVVTVEPTKTATLTEEESGDIEIDEGLLNVKITLPADFFEDMTDFDPDAYAEENGFKETVVNEDGSITITMSKKQHNELMAELKADIDNTLEELIEAEDTPYIKEIVSSKGYETVTIKVDKESYENSWDLTPLLIYFSVAFYQVFDNAEPHCEVIIEDVETGEVLGSVIYPDAFEE